MKIQFLPIVDSPALDELWPVSVDDVIELYVTSAINSNGTYSFAIVSENRNGTDYYSSEDLNNPPELIITTTE